MALGGLADERFIFVGELLDGPKSRQVLPELFRKKHEWILKPDALSALALRLERDGLIDLIDSDGQRLYRATRSGAVAWKTRYDYIANLTDMWKEQRHTLSPKKFPDSQPRDREIRIERLPSPGEVLQILKHSSPAFGLLIEAAAETGRNAYELANARIEDIDWRHRVLHLPERAITGTTISDREVPIDARFRSLLERASGGRSEGAIFLSPTNNEWSWQAIGSQFRRARRKAGLPDNLVISGRGRGAT